jgi:hypothetical protein
LIEDLYRSDRRCESGKENEKEKEKEKENEKKV